MPLKTCPQCNKQAGPRTITCTCGHVFIKKTKGETPASTTAPTPPEPVTAVVEYTPPAPEPEPPSGPPIVYTRSPAPPAKTLRIETTPTSETPDPFPPDKSSVDALKNAITLAEGLMATDFEKMELFKLAAQARRLANRLEELARRYEHIESSEAPNP